jgi:peptidoglycan/xylan/chitin deacetylase (PgdA/CDA1 family)
MYHGVAGAPLAVEDWCFLDTAVFEQQMRFLHDNCDVIPLSSVVPRLRHGGPRRPTVAITFDDGFRNNYDLAYPVLQEFELPATIFLTTGLIGTDATLWYCRLNLALARTACREIHWNGERYALGNRAERTIASAALQRRLKEQPHATLLTAVRELVQALGDDPDAAIPPDSPFRMLGPDAIAGMMRDGLIEWGAHTRSHAILGRLPPEAQYREIADSVSRVAELTGRPCRLFAYPNGRFADYDASCLEILASLGLDAAVTAEAGENTAETPVYELRRLGIGGLADTDDFAALRAWAAGTGQ